MLDIAKLLQERATVNGQFGFTAGFTQAAEAMFSDTGGRAKGAHAVTAQQAEAVHMILNKLGRIAAGDPNCVDHWADIAGYALLAAQEIEDTQARKAEQEKPAPEVSPKPATRRRRRRKA